MRLRVVSVGRLRAPYADDIAHYEKLLSRYATLELIELRDDVQLARRLGAEEWICLLAADGSSYSSRELASWLAEHRDAGRALAFVVGGAQGPVELPHVRERLSLGPLTLPHQLARVVLLEQLYRAHKIILGEPYHY